MSPHFLASGPSRAIRRELDELYRMCADQAARIAALEGEVFLLKRELREHAEETGPTATVVSALSSRDPGPSFRTRRHL